MTTATDADLAAAARLDEATALLDFTRTRSINLNVEVRKREATIADLTRLLSERDARLADLEQQLDQVRARVEGAHASDAATRAED